MNMCAMATGLLSGARSTPRMWNTYRTLRLTAKALDVQSGTAEYSRALEEGLRGLRQADRISERESIDVVQAHLYRVQQALAHSVGHERVGSLRYCTLARGEIANADETGAPDPLACPKAAVLYQAALAVDPTNVVANNELGVLFARYGRWEDAENVFRRAPSGLAAARIVAEPLGCLRQNGKDEIGGVGQGGAQIIASCCQPRKHVWRSITSEQLGHSRYLG